MARRSPTNPRYQKYQEPAGKTRKSAAAAKPVRKEGSGTSSASSKSGSGAKSSGPRAPYDPPTAEFKRMRTLWWSLLVGGVVLVSVSFAIRQYTHFAAKTIVGGVALGLAYAAIAGALYIDFARMRPMRQAWRNGETKPDKPAKTTEKSTTEKVTIERTTSEKTTEPAEKPDKPADK